MRVYLTGADGILGTALIAALRAADATTNWTVHGVSIGDYDIADRDRVDRSVDEFEPDVIIHAAANAIVDACEADPKLALRVNICGTTNVSAASRRHDSKLVYISSDYVFDGRSRPPGGYTEDDIPNPLSVYGLTKLAGERIVSSAGRNHLIVRTSWLFGGQDERTDNVLALTRRLLRGQATELIDDQFSCPTYSADLADALVHLLTVADGFTGTVHAANTGAASWYQVGEVVLAAMAGLREGGRRLPAPRAVPMNGRGFLGGRPRDSSLNTGRLAGLGFTMPGWPDAVRRFCSLTLSELS